VLQAVGFVLPVFQPELRAVRFERADLPDELDGWTLVGADSHERHLRSPDGQFSSQWRYRRGALECRVSVDYPFQGWHELTNCYRGNGWTLIARRVVADRSGASRWPRVEADLGQPAGERGWLMFGLFDRRGEPVAPEGTHIRGWPSLRQKLERSPLGSWLLGWRVAGETDTTYQVQVFVSGLVDLTPDQRAEVQQIFAAVRAGLLAAYWDKANVGERGP
jgi:hypothetical protein